MNITIIGAGRIVRHRHPPGGWRQLGHLLSRDPEEGARVAAELQAVPFGSPFATTW